MGAPKAAQMAVAKAGWWVVKRDSGWGTHLAVALAAKRASRTAE